MKLIVELPGEGDSAAAAAHVAHTLTAHGYVGAEVVVAYSCNRVQQRMECQECGYPLSEARFPTDPAMPHIVDGKPAGFCMTVVNGNDWDEARGRYRWHTEALTYEETVEILAAIRDTPKRGNECFDDARVKAQRLLDMMPPTDY